MTKKLKLALAALLGFSAACTTVRNAPEKSEPQTEAGAEAAPAERPRIVAMYGVRSPRADSVRRQRPYSEVDPVAEQPQPDSVSEAVGTGSAKR